MQEGRAAPRQVGWGGLAGLWGCLAVGKLIVLTLPSHAQCPWTSWAECPCLTLQGIPWIWPLPSA